MSANRVVLVVLDGWGYSSVYQGNAIAQANTPVFDWLWRTYPHALLQASGEAVGLPWGEMGNSEVGHLNIGAGRVVPQNLPRISASIADGSFWQNEALHAACAHVNETGGTLHLIGLASAGGIHSHIRHLFACLKLAQEQGVTAIKIHAFTDGRDAPTKAGAGQIAKLEEELVNVGVGQVASVSGRYYAMDRDHHWDRVKLAYDAIARGEGPTAASASEAVQQAYDRGETDEFVVPTVISGSNPEPWTDRDAVISFNFRPDRVRQLTNAFVRSDFADFDRQGTPNGLFFVTMTEYEKGLPAQVAFHPQNIDDSLARVLADHNVRQFHLAETEKYPHATFFFNGGYEEAYPGEERLLIASPAVATYNQQPAMSANKITDELTHKIADATYPFIMANYANADMVGHSGDFAATVQAVQTVDQCLERVVAAAAEHDTFVLITADHGNAEEMVNNTTGEVDTEHTTNPVPFMLIIPASALSDTPIDNAKLSYDKVPVPTGLLGDVAPTILKLLDIPPPEGMAGYGLL